MACLSQYFTALKIPPIPTSSNLTKFQPLTPKHQKQPIRTHPRIVCAVAVNNAETRERLKLKQLFQDACERCLTAPMEGVPFTLEDFHNALDKYDFNSEIGTKVKGTVFSVEANGALVDIPAKSSAFLPLQEACIYKLKSVDEAGIIHGLTDEFMIIGENEDDDSLVLSLRAVQCELAWERCRQLQAEDVVVKGKVVGANKGGLVVDVEALRGFVPFSQILSKATAEELMDKELPLKFMEIDQEQSRMILSNRKAVADSQSQLGIGTVVTGTVQSLKPYGAFIDIGGINGLLHVSQISHDRIADIESVLQPGDTVKVMVLSHDRDRGRVSLSTKKLEPTPGDMIRNPKLVFEKADEMAQTFRQRIAQAEAMARVDMVRFQPEGVLKLSPDGLLGAHSDDMPNEGLDLSALPLFRDS